MIIKNPKHRGKRTCIKCLNCGEEFLELDTKIKEGRWLRMYGTIERVESDESITDLYDSIARNE